MQLGALSAGDEEGRAMVASAENALREGGTRRPDAFARIFVPGATATSAS